MSPEVFATMLRRYASSGETLKATVTLRHLFLFKTGIGFVHFDSQIIEINIAQSQSQHFTHPHTCPIQDLKCVIVFWFICNHISKLYKLVKCPICPWFSFLASKMFWTLFKNTACEFWKSSIAIQRALRYNIYTDWFCTNLSSWQHNDNRKVF